MKEDYEKYLLDKIEVYKKSLTLKNVSGRVREVWEFELQQFALRLFNFRKGRQSQKEEELEFLKRLIRKNKPTKEREGVYYWNDKIALMISKRIERIEKQLAGVNPECSKENPFEGLADNFNYKFANEVIESQKPKEKGLSQEEIKEHNKINREYKKQGLPYVIYKEKFEVGELSGVKGK